MEILAEVLPIVIDVLLVVLLTVLIIIGIKVIKVMDRVKLIINDVEGKLATLNGFFSLLDTINSKVTLFSDKVISMAESLVSKLFNKASRRATGISEEEELEEILREERMDD